MAEEVVADDAVELLPDGLADHLEEVADQDLKVGHCGPTNPQEIESGGGEPDRGATGGDVADRLRTKLGIESSRSAV